MCNQHSVCQVTSQIPLLLLCLQMVIHSTIINVDTSRGVLSQQVQNKKHHSVCVQRLYKKKQLYRHMTDTNPAHFILINFVCVYFLWCHREVTKSNQLEAT